MNWYFIRYLHKMRYLNGAIDGTMLKFRGVCYVHGKDWAPIVLVVDCNRLKQQVYFTLFKSLYSV